MEDTNKTIITKYFTNELMSDLSSICDSFDITDNNERADKMLQLLKYENFYEVGCGTNRIVVAHPERNDYVFKIALDDRGIKDNNVESKLSKILSPKGYVTENYENIGLISVAEKVETMTSFDMDERSDDVFDVINSLKDFYVLNDVGPTSFKNWGINDDGNVVILDYAYLSDMNDINIKHCTKCGGNLSYDESLSKLVCMDCDKEYSFGVVTGGVMEDDLESMGFTNDTIYDENNDNLLSQEELKKTEEIDFLKSMGFDNRTEE